MLQEYLDQAKGSKRQKRKSMQQQLVTSPLQYPVLPLVAALLFLQRRCFEDTRIPPFLSESCAVLCNTHRVDLFSSRSGIPRQC